MTVNTEQKVESARKKLESLKSSFGENGPGTEEKVKLRKVVKLVKRAQRKDKVKQTYKSKLESQDANRLKNIQNSEEKAAKQKAAKESALNAAAEEQAQQASASEEAATQEAAPAEAPAKEDNAPEEKEAKPAS